MLPRLCGRTVLRRFADSDLARFQAYRLDPEVALYQDWEAMSDDDALSFIQDQSKAHFFVPGNWHQIAIAGSTSGTLIGDIGVFVDSEEKGAEIGFGLSRQYQKRGLGRESVTEAVALIFEHTKVDTVVGIADARNQASINLLTAIGMNKIKTMETVFRGEPCTELVYSLERTRKTI